MADYDSPWVLIHVEVQMSDYGKFPWRMCVYNYRLFDKYKRGCQFRRAGRRRLHEIDDSRARNLFGAAEAALDAGLGDAIFRPCLTAIDRPLDRADRGRNPGNRKLAGVPC